MRIELDTKDSRILKGLAIAAIVFHNFFHLFSHARENEFSFEPQRFHFFLAEVRHPESAIPALFSFWGHFGVQIFIFLAAYGLTKSYWDDSSSWGQFMLGRVKKLYPLFALIVVPWMFAAYVLAGQTHFFRDVAPQSVLLFLGIPNVLRFAAPVGPWWFIPFILQLYALWPLLRRLTIRFGWRGLIVLALACFVFTSIANPFLARWSINLLATPIGRMKGICFGVLVARYPIKIDARVAALALVVLVAGSQTAALWPLTFFAVLLLALWAYMQLRNQLRRSWLLERLGKYSLFIFLLNALVRDCFLHFVTSPASCLLWAAVSASVTFVISAAIYELAMRNQPRRKAQTAPALVVPSPSASV